MIITIFTDNDKSWFIQYGNILLNRLCSLGHSVKYINNKMEISNGDICFILSCSKIINKEFLLRNKHNIVVHASDLPLGKGFSPLQWQILENNEEIVLTLFEAAEIADAGPFYLKDKIKFSGIELYNEMRTLLAEKIIEMCINYVRNLDGLIPVEQAGKESFYRKRNEDDDRVDPEKSIAEQFNHFRIADNDNFPLWFIHKNRKYYLRISAESEKY